MPHNMMFNRLNLSDVFAKRIYKIHFNSEMDSIVLFEEENESYQLHLYSNIKNQYEMNGLAITKRSSFPDFNFQFCGTILSIELSLFIDDLNWDVRSIKFRSINCEEVFILNCNDGFSEPTLRLSID